MRYILTALLLFLTGCINQPTTKAISYTTNQSNSTILQLDTKGHTARIWDIIVTKSGDIISASDDKTIRVWSSKTGKEKRKILGQIGAGSEGMIYAIALSPNEEFLAIGGFIKKPSEKISTTKNSQRGVWTQTRANHLYEWRY